MESYPLLNNQKENQYYTNEYSEIHQIQYVHLISYSMKAFSLNRVTNYTNKYKTTKLLSISQLTFFQEQTN